MNRITAVIYGNCPKPTYLLILVFLRSLPDLFAEGFPDSFQLATGELSQDYEFLCLRGAL
jgi:hypothetical protein